MWFEEFQEPPWWPSWISEQNDFSNSESLCCPNTSHQVWAQSNLAFRNRYHLKNSKMAPMAIVTEQFIAIVNLLVLSMLPINLQLNLMVWEEMLFEQYQDRRHCGHFGYRNGRILAILNLHVTRNPPTKFGLIQT